MKKYFYIAMLLCAVTAFSQEAKTKDSIYTGVEKKPSFPGGMPVFYKYVAENYKIPATFKESGKLIARFVIEKDGSVTDINIIRDLGFGTGDELVRILKNSPKWSPGIQLGVPVRVLYYLPVSISGKK